MRYTNPIDPHVHLRGDEYDVNYASMALTDAAAVGLAGLIEMPNCKPFLTDRAAIVARLRHIRHLSYQVLGQRELFHGIHPGITTGLHQMGATLVDVATEWSGLSSDKIFYTHSTGNMGILDPELQREIWMYKGKVGYKGVSIGHFEDEQQYVGTFDPANPLSHSEHQHEGAETVQVERQIRNAFDAKFRGTFYVAHVSSPQTVDFLISEEKKGQLPFNVVIEATFHHIFLNHSDYFIHGNRVKMNPPLRCESSQKRLLQDVLDDRIDIIGTDHAPHPVAAKDSPKPPSGIPAIAFWPRGIELLRKSGINEGQLERQTFHTANDLFKLGLDARSVDCEYQPELWEKYGWNPFLRVDGSSPALAESMEPSRVIVNMNAINRVEITD